MIRMISAVCAFALLVGCSAPQPKAPYEGERVPVNKVVPAELEGKATLAGSNEK